MEWLPFQVRRNHYTLAPYSGDNHIKSGNFALIDFT